jgi:hypothetical protein
MRILIVAGGLVCACALASQGAPNQKKIEKELNGVPRPELAAKIAEIIRLSPAHERSEAAAIAIEVVERKYPAAASSVIAGLSKASPEVAAAAQARIKDRPSAPPVENSVAPGKSDGNGNGNGNGGVGHGPGPNKPGKIIVDDKPINVILPNGKPRHFPPDPPRRPVDPPRPINYNSPREH